MANSRSHPLKRYGAAFMLCLAAAILPTMARSQPAQTWRRSAMHQGYYAAYVANASGAELRILCGPASDGGKDDVQSLIYVPPHTISRRPQLPGTIGVDGKTQKFAFKAEKTDADDRTVVRVGADDLDSLEGLKDLVGRLRHGTRLTIAAPAINIADAFSLQGAAHALGSCQ